MKSFTKVNLSVLTPVSLFQIYIASKLTKTCVRVQAGDRFGVYTEEAPGAIAYTFAPSSPGCLIHKQSEPVGIYEVVNFGSIVLPYKLSMAAFMDTNMSLHAATDDNFPNCPNLRIPSYVNVTVPTVSSASPVKLTPTVTSVTTPDVTTAFALTTTTSTTTTATCSLYIIAVNVGGFVLLIATLAGLNAYYCKRYGYVFYQKIYVFYQIVYA